MSGLPADYRGSAAEVAEESGLAEAETMRASLATATYEQICRLPRDNYARGNFSIMSDGAIMSMPAFASETEVRARSSSEASLTIS